MSRIGKQILNIPEKTELTVADGNVSVKGPLGSLTMPFREDYFSVKNENNTLEIIPKRNSSSVNVMWGTTVSLIKNMLEGVSKGFSKKLIIEGVGYKAEVKGDKLVLAIGFSHPVPLDIPEGLKVTADVREGIVISGIDKQLVGQFAASVRANKKPEPYKGKGIRYSDEVIRRKQGKKTA
jgi:large subunit ribosomal protein L6